MRPDDLVRRAYEAFRSDVAVEPPLTLRGGNDVDGYSRPSAFDPAIDEPTDNYLEGFAFWGLGYLDARSWRHYLPRLIDYALRTPADPAMVIEALVRSLRPPDRYPPRLATLNPDQESVVRSFLELVALSEAVPHVQTDAQQALEEWWLPNPRSRPTAEDISALRATPMTYRSVVGDVYRLSLPDTFTGSGVREIPQEFRRVQTWGGYLCGDVHTVVAINVTQLAKRSIAESVRFRAPFLREGASDESIAVRGSPQSQRLRGLVDAESPAEPYDMTMIFAIAGDEVVTLSLRTFARDDVDREVARILESFEIIAR